MTAVTSDQLLAFIEKATLTATKLNRDGDVVAHVAPKLEGDALAKALETLATLSINEQHIQFSRQQYEDSHGGVLKSMNGPMAN